MRKTILTLVSIALLSSSSYAIAADYSKDSNPFGKYVYTNPLSEQKPVKAPEPKVTKSAQPQYNTNFSSPNISSNMKKYRNLQNNSASIHGCWDKAGIAYGVDPWLLFAIAKVESSFNHSALNTNSNKSTDMGMMQINTIWLPTLKKFGISREHLFDACTSVFVGAWIVAQNIKRFGYNQDGIGAYNSPGNITIRRNYAKKVYSAYNELTRDFGVQVKR